MSKSSDDVCIFFVDTHFQQMARRPGGVPREKALEIAETVIAQNRTSFYDWLEGELGGLLAAIRAGRRPDRGDRAWAEKAFEHARHIRDVGATMGYELLSFVANNLCHIFDAIAAGENRRDDIIDCHIEALLLAKQEQYRQLRPEQLPELSSGLARVLKVASQFAKEAAK